ncbi:MAG: hypothetical protein PHP17_02650 [Candidatus Omnitrophica bacterium]|nr:hypothetical protein [Candidatus Omnitrophota bacterium]
MRIKKIYILSAFLLCFSFVCAQFLSAEPNEPKVYSGNYQPYYEPVPEISIFYSVKKYSLTQDYDILITNRGDVIVHEKDYYDKRKVYNAKLSESELNALADFILKADIFQFKNEYVVDKDFIDSDGERLRITVGKRTKQIVISSATGPVEIRAIINKLEEIRQRMKKPEEDARL